MAAPDPVQARGSARAAALAAGRPPRRGRPARSPAGLRLHPGGSRLLPGAHGRERRGSGGLHGHGHAAGRAVGAPQAALRLFQAELRPGHQSADRPDPRRAGDEPGLDDRPEAQSARPPGRNAQAAGGRPAGPDQRRPGEDPRHFRSAGRRLPHRDPGRHLAGGRGRGRPRAGARPTLRGGHRRGSGRHEHPHPVGPRGLRGSHPHSRRPGHRRGAPPPDPPGPAHADRPGRSRPARRARCIISASWPATGPKR